MSVNLNPQKALIFRIVHVENVPWILEHDGMHCRDGDQDPNYVNIGNTELIDKRAGRNVPIPPGGTLIDYVPFYFTPYSIMMYNIHTGHGGIPKRNNQDILIFVSSIHRLHELNIPFVFTNQHAYSIDAEYFSDPTDLRLIDWPLLQSRSFKTDDTDPGKQVRYQAEALVHRHVPLAALHGIGCLNTTVQQNIAALLSHGAQEIAVKTRPGWYF